MTEKHEYLKKEDYYENREVQKGKTVKLCEQCFSDIKKGTPHDVHHFYPEFRSYPTHKECTEKFLESLN